MPKGTRYASETAEFIDPITGALTLQLTSNPTTSENLYFENMCFTPDGGTLIFKSRRTSERGAPYDLYRVGTDGKNLIQLTDCDDLSNAALSLDGTRVFYTATDELRCVNIDDFSEEVIAHFDGARNIHGPSIGGDYVFARAEFGNAPTQAFRVREDGTGLDIFAESRRIIHVTASRTGNRVCWTTFNDDNTQVFMNVARGDGSDARLWCEDRWAHASWVGGLDRMQGTLLPPGHGLTWASPDDETPQEIAAGPYFWHSSASLDGEWIIADTNWPDIGLQLVHVESGRYLTLCLSQASAAHPHPSFNHDGSWVVYNSDRTGICQVYIVQIPEYLKEELMTGELQKRQKPGRRMI